MKKKFILLLTALTILVFSIPAMAEITVIKTRGVVYPRINRLRQEEGTAKIHVTIGENGVPEDIYILQSTGFTRLDKCAKYAVSKWLFLGAEEGTRLIQPVEFAMAEKTLLTFYTGPEGETVWQDRNTVFVCRRSILWQLFHGSVDGTVFNWRDYKGGNDK